jgi:hypothetical protein
MLPPKTPAEWHESISGFTDSSPNPYSETDERCATGMKLLGLPGLVEKPMTIAGEERGMIVIWHNDIFHRRSRQQHPGIQDYPAPLGKDYSDPDEFPGSGINFRPYVRMGFFRAAEPTAPAWVDDGSSSDADGWVGAAAPTGHAVDDSLDDVASSLWQPRMEWLADGRGRSTLYERSAEEVSRLAGEMCSSGSEAVRMTAGGKLAHTVDDLGIAALVTAMEGGAEAPARAATYGLACAGDAAVAPLVTLLAGPAPPVPAGSASSSASPDRPLYRKDKIAYALGRAASTAESLSLAVEALAAACKDAVADTLLLTQHMSAAEVEEATAYAMSGGRGYGGDCYAGRVVPDQRSVRKNKQTCVPIFFRLETFLMLVCSLS